MLVPRQVCVKNGILSYFFTYLNVFLQQPQSVEKCVRWLSYEQTFWPNTLNCVKIWIFALNNDVEEKNIVDFFFLLYVYLSM